MESRQRVFEVLAVLVKDQTISYEDAVFVLDYSDTNFRAEFPDFNSDKLDHEMFLLEERLKTIRAKFGAAK